MPIFYKTAALLWFGAAWLTLATANPLVPFDTTAATNAALAGLKARYNDSTSLEIVFDVVIYSSVREKEEKRSGHAWFARGDHFKLESGDNIYQSDGRTYWQYNRQTKQVIIKHLLDVDLPMLPSQMVSDYIQNYAYRIVRADGERTVLQSTTAPSGLVQSITIAIKPKTATIQSIVVNDKNGNRSTYIITKIRSGIPLTDDFFVFDIPKGTDVFDSRQ